MPNQARILLVDDLEANLVALEAVLWGIDAQIVKARSGEEACRRVLEHDFAVILLDVQMPHMDGFETATLIRRRDRSRHVPIIFITAINKADAHVFRGYSLGAVDYIFKPIVPEVLRAKVSVFVDLFRMRQNEKLALEALHQKTVELERSNADLAQFAHVAAHDMQEPLRTVTRYLRLLSRRYADKLDASGVEFVDYALKGSQELLDLIHDLLDYSRIGSHRRASEEVDCEVLVDRAISDLAQAVDESHARITHEHLPVVNGDAQRLGRVFQNLLSNAIKFRSKAPPLIHVSGDRHGDDWLIQVRDNGIGIDAEDRGRLFSLFGRLHGRNEYPGTGVGLAICRRVIEDHGGEIWVETNPTGGSVFAFTLPAVAPKAPAELPSTATP